MTSRPCPHCGELVPLSSKRCRYCGFSDEDPESDSFEDFGDDDFDYDDFVAREFPEEASPESPSVRRRRWIRIVAVLLIIAFLAASFW